MSLLWIFAFLIAERLFELAFSRRNYQRLKKQGGREYYAETFKTIVALHSLFLLSLLWESYPWQAPLDLHTWSVLTNLIVLQAMRYWCMASLGENWNARIVLVPGGKVKRKGPYRLMRHPNYLVVILEFVCIPLLMHAYVTMIVFSLANLAILKQRIRLEEDALRQMTDYSLRFPHKKPF